MAQTWRQSGFCLLILGAWEFLTIPNRLAILDGPGPSNGSNLSCLLGDLARVTLTIVFLSDNRKRIKLALPVGRNNAILDTIELVTSFDGRCGDGVELTRSWVVVQFLHLNMSEVLSDQKSHPVDSWGSSENTLV